MHAQSGMDLKPLWNTLLTILFKQIVSRSHPLPGGVTPYLQDHDCLRSSQEFFLCENHIFWTYLMKFTNYISVPSWDYGLCICSEVYFQIAFGDFSVNIADRLWSEKMLTICGFHIEKKSWLKWFSLGDPRPSWACPGRGWLRDTSCLNRMVRKVFHKGF